MIELSTVEVAWGWLGLAQSEGRLCGLTLPVATAEAALSAIAREHPTGQVSSARYDGVAQQLRRYFLGERVVFTAPLELPDSPPFWGKVWRSVAAIPYGETRSYGAVAALAGAPGGARAVGQAMAHNPVPIIVPCHRVVGSDGRLTGFGGGLDMKRRLLTLEGAATVH